MESYDVVIIGAGPAGLKCAETLGNSKLKVLILEQNKIIGPKTCGGGLTELNDIFRLPIDKCRSFRKQEAFLNGKRYYADLIHPLKIIDSILKFHAANS